MMKAAFPTEICNAAALHLDVLDSFIAVVEGKLAQATDAFARDSLTDLLTSLTEQRETYVAFAAPMVTAAAA